MRALTRIAALEGRTEWQRNPHPPESLARLSWIVTRFGDWNCSGRKPKPKVVRRRWNRFSAIARGFSLVSRELRKHVQTW